MRLRLNDIHAHIPEAFYQQIPASFEFVPHPGYAVCGPVIASSAAA